MVLDLDELYRILRAAHVEAQGVLDTLRDPLLILDENLYVLSANPAFYRVFATGRDETLEKPFLSLAGRLWDAEELELLLRKVIPRSSSVFDFEVTGDFPRIGQRTMLLSAMRLNHPDDGRRLLMVTIVDATERRAAERRKDLLLRETDHRIKNLLGVAQALARQTGVTGRTASEYRDAFLERFEALVRAHEVSTSTTSSRLPDLALAVLAPYLGARRAIRVAAEPEVQLAPRQVSALGMVLHELATNALKHGALSVPAGQVDLTWSVSDSEGQAPLLTLEWAEQNGPDVSEPAATGFGTKLIAATVTSDLGGTLDTRYAPSGLVVTVSFPLRTP